MSATSKATVKAVARTPRPPLTDAEIAALEASIGPVDPTELARVRAAQADAIHSPGGTDPLAVAAEFRARRVGERGPQVAPVKKQISFRIRPAVLEAWRATGPGWMARMDEFLATAPFVKLPPVPGTRR